MCIRDSPGSDQDPPSSAARAPSAAVVLVAAGSSTRMGPSPNQEGRGGPAGPAGPDRAARRKPLIEIDGRPLIEHTLAALDACRAVVEVILVAHADDVLTFQRLCAERPVYAKVRAVVAGGAERADSVDIGTSWCSFAVDVIAVHDAARPLVTPELIEECVRAAAQSGGALVAVPLQDTVKVAPDGERAQRTLDRTTLWSAQTPQAFRARRFREVLRRAAADDFRPTDDAAVWERYVGPVTIVRGSIANLKVTTPADLSVAGALLRERAGEPR